MKKGLFKYLLVAAVVFAAVCAVCFFYGAGAVNDEKILASSPLRNKNFSGRVQEVKSAGMSAYLLEEHSVPAISMSFIFLNAGSAHEPENKQGLTDLLADLLTDGAGKYDAQSFKEACEEYGIKISFAAKTDNITGYMQMPRSSLDKALEMLKTVFSEPRFDGKFINLRKEQLKAAVKLAREDPLTELGYKFAGMMFAGHPYARTSEDKAKNVDNVTADDLRGYMQTHLTRQNLITGFAGDLTAEDVASIMQNVFALLPEKCACEKLPQVKVRTDGAEYDIKRDSAQASVMFAVGGAKRESSDFYPLYLANYIFGGSGLSSRISRIIREQHGLTYGIYTYMTEAAAAPLLRGEYSATPENFGKAQELLQKEWNKMAQKGVTAEELQKAKESLIASYNLRFASLGGIASMLAGMQKYNLGRDFLEKRNDYIRNVTLSEVNRAAEKYFSVKPVFVTTGTKEEIKNNVRKK